MKQDKDKGNGPSIKLWLIVFSLIAAFSLIFVDYRPEKAKLLSSRFNEWIHQKSIGIDEKIVEVKEISTKEQEKPQEIHFEFYTVLPNVRVPVPETDKPLAVSAPIPNLFDPNHLQNALKEEFAEQQQYVVQTGVFKYVAGAERIHQALLKAGLPVRVIKIRMARGKAYSVQAGPFSTKDQARSIQQQLKKKNINGIIRKL